LQTFSRLHPSLENIADPVVPLRNFIMPQKHGSATNMVLADFTAAGVSDRVDGRDIQRTIRTKIDGKETTRTNHD
jgi:hypothetical protein